MLDAWLVSRFVSGLGVRAKAAAFPLVGAASGDPTNQLFVCLAAGAWRRWRQPEYDLSRTLSNVSSDPPSTATSASSAAGLPPYPSPTGRAPAFEPAASITAALHCNFTATLAASTCRVSTFSTSSSRGVAAGASPVPTLGVGQADQRGHGSFAVAIDAAGEPGARPATWLGGSTSSEQDPSLMGEAKPDLVEKFLSLGMCSASVQRQVERQDVLKDFQRHPVDTGSPPVMVALWTHRIRSLVKVFDAGRKQIPAIRQLEMMVNRRRRMLTWLRRADFESYSYTISKLGLRDIYVPAGFADRYREGTRSSDSVDDEINRLRFNFHTKYRQGKTSMWYRLRPKLLAEDPALQSADADAAVVDRQRRQQRREVAAQQRMTVEREQRRAA